MQRQQNPEKRSGGHCKIRKRVSSSSSSSSVVKNYRFKRAILVGKRAGSSTPVPTWKVIMAAGSRSPVHRLQNFELNGVISSSNNYSNNYFNQIRGKEGFSARKLAATLWENNGLPFPGSERRKSFDRVGPVCEVGENNSSFKTRLKDVSNNLVASKELVKVLFRILSHEEQHSSRMTLASALRVELDRARLQIDQMIQEQRYNSNEIDTLLKNFAEEKATWKSKEKERIREAVSSIGRELEIERKLRRQAERLNKKLEIELANTKAHLSRAMKDLEGEKRAKEILEQTCDELARGIEEERVEVEELRHEREKLREEVEKERQMVQLADVLREERVQMKLTDARYEYEEKNAALERLKTELEIYYKNQGSSKNKGNGDNGVYELDSKIEFIKKTQGKGGVDEDGGEDSGESELHSIELSMDNRNKSYKWSYVCDGTNEGEPRRAPIDEVFKGRRSLSEKIQWENICLQRTTSSDGIEWEFAAKKQGNNNNNIDGFDEGIRSCSQGSASEESPGISTGRFSCLREACNAILLDLASRKATNR